MCSPSAPKASSTKVEKVPERQPILLPDNGDPLARLRGSDGRLRASAMIIANRIGTLGAPSVAAPLGTRGM